MQEQQTVLGYNGEDAIIDSKTSKKIKKEEWIEVFIIQCCAYAMAQRNVWHKY